MASYPVTGIESAVAWGSTNFYSVLIAAMTKNEATLDEDTTVLDGSALGSASTASLPGLRGRSGTIRGHCFATPVVGNVGIASWSGRYLALLRGFDVTIETVAVHEYTPLNIDPATALAGTPTDLVFRPDAIRWFGTIDMSVDIDTELTQLDKAGDSSVSLVLTMNGAGTPATLTGNAYATRMGKTARRGALQTVQYAFTGTGNLTAAGTGNPFGTTAFGSAVPVWHSGVALDNTTNATTLLTLTDSASYNHKLDAFWTRIRVRVQQNELVSLEVDYQGNGPRTTTES